MNYFSFTIKRKKLKELKQSDFPSIVASFYMMDMIPAEEDRVYFNNFPEVFVVTGVEKLAEDCREIDEASKPYYVGTFRIDLKILYSDFEIVRLKDLILNREYLEIGQVAGDVWQLLTKFEAIGDLAMKTQDGVVSAGVSMEEFLSDNMDDRAEEYWCEMIPSLFADLIQKSDYSEREFIVAYDPFIVYLDGYMPVALMGRYTERDAENDELSAEYISTIFVDEDVADEFGLEVSDIQFMIDELFAEVIEVFEPGMSAAIMENPMAVVPISQVDYVEGLIDNCGWVADEDEEDMCFGYRIFN